MLLVKLQKILSCMILMVCVSACGQTGDLYLPGSEEAQDNEKEEAVQKSTLKSSQKAYEKQSKN